MGPLTATGTGTGMQNCLHLFIHAQLARWQSGGLPCRTPRLSPMRRHPCAARASSASWASISARFSHPAPSPGPENPGMCSRANRTRPRNHTMKGRLQAGIPILGASGTHPMAAHRHGAYFTLMNIKELSHKNRRRSAPVALAALHGWSEGHRFGISGCHSHPPMEHNRRPHESDPHQPQSTYCRPNQRSN